MEPITSQQIAAAVTHLDSLDLAGRVGLTEEMRANQPHVMQAMDKVSPAFETPQVDHVLYVVRVIYTACSATTEGKFPMVTPENFQKVRLDLIALSDAIGRGNLTQEVYLEYYPEPNLLTWVCIYMDENVPDDPTHKYDPLMLTVTEIVNAFSAVRATANLS